MSLQASNLAYKRPSSTRAGLAACNEDLFTVGGFGSSSTTPLQVCPASPLEGAPAGVEADSDPWQADHRGNDAAEPPSGNDEENQQHVPQQPPQLQRPPLETGELGINDRTVGGGRAHELPPCQATYKEAAPLRLVRLHGARGLTFDAFDVVFLGRKEDAGVLCYHVHAWKHLCYLLFVFLCRALHCVQNDVQTCAPCCSQCIPQLLGGNHRRRHYVPCATDFAIDHSSSVFSDGLVWFVLCAIWTYHVLQVLQGREETNIQSCNGRGGIAELRDEAMTYNTRNAARS